MATVTYRSDWMGTVLGSLAEIRNDAEWHCIPLKYVGADHERDRVYIVAYPHEARCEDAEGRPGPTEQDWRQILTANALGRGFHRWPDQPEMGRVVHGISADVDAVSALGNSVSPGIIELIGKAILSTLEGAK